ncbi:alpha-glucoside:hydrogen symporter [Dacryopinax primogenitus]|uniref:Alpha-glucoside:hydrogen symporter n=1 Tax=Dacryopinax primogenitus (strain DJM 731) TaxID=1858805 RepID=M5G9D0_DACPD|nr:alpha-glucoside:hydrogen symporter [Dacryopinax primogenitus]EJU00398.1 alpha-glucoside:hydrogen symporter [Dacryopinax primogenitus]
MSTLPNTDSKSLAEVEHIEEQHGVSWEQIKEEAHRAIEAEQNMTPLEALRKYPMAVFWSWVISLAVLMEGFDTNLLGSLFALPAFQQAYGSYSDVSKSYTLSAPWQSGISQASTCGTFIGIILNGYLIDRFGYKRTLLVMLVFITGFIAIPTFAPNPATLVVGEFLCGIPWGVFCTLAPAYASEVAPVQLRGYLTTYVNLCFVIGHFLALGVLNGVETWTSQWAYRVPFCLQWMWPVPIFITVCFAPESPWWLVRKGRLAEAETMIKRLSKNSPINPRDAVAMMVRTNQLEIDQTEGTRFIDCLKGPDLRRTEVSCVAWAIQIFCGLPFLSWDTYFFEQAGLASSNAFKVSLAVEGLSFIGVFLSWVFLTWLGRRTIYLGGQLAMVILMLLVGFLQIASNKGSKDSNWGQGAMLMLWCVVYNGTIGPLAFCIAAETSSTRLRGKTIALARNTYNIVSIVFGIVTPYMLNPNEGNWKGFTGFWWAGIGFIFAVWSYYRLPECKGRTYWELDILFERKVPAREFKAAVVSNDADEQLHGAHNNVVTMLGEDDEKVV